jgi:hypothetical protein
VAAELVEGLVEVVVIEEVVEVGAVVVQVGGEVVPEVVVSEDRTTIFSHHVLEMPREALGAVAI